MKLLNGIGLGTFPFASPFTHVTEETVKNLVRYYLDNGGMYIDTAPTYAFGGVEQLLGNVFSEYPREQFFINTFCGYVIDSDTGQFVKSGRYEDVIKDCDESLSRLGLDYLDAYGHHIPDPNVPISETMQALLDLKEKGKTQRIGVSNVSLDELKEYNSSGNIDYVEMRYSLLTQGLTLSRPFIDYCVDNNIHIVAYQVIERGLLTNKNIEGFEIRDGDLRNRKPEFEQGIRQEIGQWVSRTLRPIADELSVEVSTLVIWWALNQRGISLCQVGATRQEHVQRLLDVLKLSPDQTVIDRVDRGYRDLTEHLRESCGQTVLEFMGLADNAYANLSASGK